MKYLKKMLYSLALILFLIFFLGPIIWTFIISITPDALVLEKSLNFLPRSFSFNNYKILLNISSRQGNLLFRGMNNAIYASFITIIICIPIYKLFMQLKLLNNMYMLSLVYVTAYLPIITWLTMNYFMSIPKDLDEAAMVDGCSKFMAFIKVILPISFPIIASSILIIFLSTWSQFQIPLILASNESTKPIAIITSEFSTKDTIHYGLTAAAGILALIPPMVLAILFRRFLVSGMMKGSVKA